MAGIDERGYVSEQLGKEKLRCSLQAMYVHAQFMLRTAKCIELTSRVERIESGDFLQTKSCDADHGKLIEEEYRTCTSELFAIVKQHGATLGKQEIAMSSLREDLKTEQRIRKDEIHPKLRELAARPVRPEEQSINDLRQSVMFVRDECSKLRAECRKLSSEAMARDSEGLAKVLRQLSDMRNLLDNGTMEETVQLPVSLGKFNLPKRPGETKPGRISPVRDRALQVRSMSARKPGRGSKPEPTKVSNSSSIFNCHVPLSHGDEAKVKAAGIKTEWESLPPADLALAEFSLMAELEVSLDESLAENEELKIENEALEVLMDKVQALAEEWQAVCMRKAQGEQVDDVLEELRQRRQKAVERLEEINRGDFGPRERRESDDTPEMALSRAEGEAEALRSQNNALKEAIQQARARIHSKLEKHQADNLALKDDHEELKSLCQEAQKLTKQWQQIWDLRKTGVEHTEEEAEVGNWELGILHKRTVFSG
eukprot:s306_g15.t1